VYALSTDTEIINNIVLSDNLSLELNIELELVTLPFICFNNTEFNTFESVFILLMLKAQLLVKLF